jgi:hypothetical protein
MTPSVLKDGYFHLLFLFIKLPSFSVHLRVPRLLTKTHSAERHLIDTVLPTNRQVVHSPNDQMFVEQMSVDQIFVNQMSVDQMSVNQMSVNQMSVNQMSVNQMYVDQMSLNQKSIDQMSIDHISVN